MLRKWLSSYRKNGRSCTCPLGQASRGIYALPAIEALERREVPSCTISIINRVLTVQCDNASSNYVTADVQANFTVINGQSFNFTTHDSIRINGGTGKTTTNIHAVGKPLLVLGDSSAAD